MKKGTITVGKNVIVMWEKSKKTCNVQVLDIGVGVHSPPNPQQDMDDPLAFDLVALAMQMQAVDLPSPISTHAPQTAGGRRTSSFCGQAG